jgi:hypothetical protein
MLLLPGCAAQAPKVTYRLPESIPPVVSPAEQQPLPPETSVPVAAQEIAKPFAPAPAAEETEQEPSASTDVTDRKSDTNDNEYISQRLAAYERKFQQWLEGQPEGFADKDPWNAIVQDACLSELNSLLTGYNQLLAQPQRPRTSADEMQSYSERLDILQLDINFLESDCARKLDQVTSSLIGSRSGEAEIPVSSAQTEKILADYFQQGAYDQVIAVFQLTAKTHPEIIPSRQSRQMYSMAQLHSGNMEVATENLQGVLNEIESDGQQLQPWILQRLTADLLLASGKYKEARLLYGQLLAASDSFASEESWARRQLSLMNEINPADLRMKSYTDFLRSFLIYDKKKHASVDILAKADKLLQLFPNTPVADSTELLKQQVENQLTDWIDKLLIEAEALRNEKKYQQAQTLLAEVNQNHLPAALREQIIAAIAGTKDSEIQELETQRVLLEQSHAEQWQSAITLLDAEQFDAALNNFKTLLNTDYNEQAVQKINEATNLAAAAQRKASASLFIRAVKTQNPQTKKELLLESRRLLQDVLTKYPQADIVDKVTQNLMTLEQHIREFNPALLDKASPDQSPGEQVEGQGTPDQPQD